ncbi:hypothetical protein LguiA_011900 [Lonicera macranthoides]
MLTNGSDLPIRTNRTKRESPSSRRPTGKISMGNSSLEVYYGGSSLSIPFMWESQPGTPKIRSQETPLPPLTPPPSYQFNPSKIPVKKHSKSSLLHSVLPKLTPKKTNSPTSPASPASSRWSSSHSIPSSPFAPNLHGQSRVSSPRLYDDSSIYEEDKHGSPVSTLCFGITRGIRGRSRGRFSSRTIKILLGECM